MAAGTVTPEVFQTYLAIEQRFVRTAAGLVGYCIWQEPRWEVVERFAASLADLVGEQTEYFAARVTPPASWPVGADALEVVVAAAVAEGGYPAVVTCLCAAETLYATWCEAAASTAAAATRALPGLAASWISLHTTPSFLAGVSFLQSLVDTLDPDVFPDSSLDQWFVRMLGAEDSFHDSALPASPPSSPRPQGEPS